ncbi:hypothetical protein FOA52_012076 [Chlamydomonas sp. UWO 241]|nr:hypothetical protein FOA52_012076 [Chlamydomonas sp. UWO 241]
MPGLNPHACAAAAGVIAAMAGPARSPSPSTAPSNTRPPVPPSQPWTSPRACGAAADPGSASGSAGPGPAPAPAAPSTASFDSTPASSATPSRVASRSNLSGLLAAGRSASPMLPPASASTVAAHDHVPAASPPSASGGGGGGGAWASGAAPWLRAPSVPATPVTCGRADAPAAAAPIATGARAPPPPGRSPSPMSSAPISIGKASLLRARPDLLPRAPACPAAACAGGGPSAGGGAAVAAAIARAGDGDVDSSGGAKLMFVSCDDAQDGAHGAGARDGGGVSTGVRGPEGDGGQEGEQLAPPAFLPRPLREAAAALSKLVDEVITEKPVQIAGVTKVGLIDFDFLRLVGQGAFGKVFQVRYKANNQLYALKVMRKDKILLKDHSEYVKAERDVLTAVVHPYIVAMRFSFQTPAKLYLVLDFLNGGHLFFNLYREGVFSEEVACLYTAEIVSALSYLHSKGIMHRDLKPENVLLDSAGHVRLTDFGLAKELDLDDPDERSNSFIGTMEYMAPEIIEGKGHSRGVDWWSTGILLFEMLAGQAPFRNKSRKVLQDQIKVAKPKYPRFLSTNALTLLKGLLTRDPDKRLGCGEGPAGSDAIKRHPFFKNINWARLERREIESTFKPKVVCSHSVENFDKLWTDQPAVDSPCGSPPAPDAVGAKLFQGFTYVEPNFLESIMAAEAAEEERRRTAAVPIADDAEAEEEAEAEAEAEEGDC